MEDNKKDAFKELLNFNLDIRKKRIELFTTWQDLFSVAKALVEQAKVSPLSVKATVLANCVRILSMSSKMLSEMDTFKKEVEDALERYDAETGEETMTDEEKKMIEDFKEMSRGTLDNSSPDTIAYNRDSSQHGFNFRRDR